ncbi:PAS domain S-box-containing protein [Kineococcus xinjiangensis]|uniref:PAS domain S-box-containing protein n=1 Tax=Kineococcus xinjiangensis TaxID=512762 RepID=A0A2S6IDM4_9ACTN|nr:ATP-binding protein [Kineococcus xinjiangensis]PPK92297.1 PAS domain S-box-containing protein [Kineococcus xinjiangensis]
MLVHRALALAPEPASAARARRAVAEALTEAGIDDDLVESATLLVSELITNAVIHARSDIGLTITVRSGAVLVEVSDRSPHLPTRRDYDATATTGRGLDLLELVADDCGALLQDSGKVVWFALGGRREEFHPAPGPAPAPSEAAPEGMAIRLHRLPVALYCAWQQHAEAVLRERLLSCFREDGSPDAGQLDEVGVASEAMSLLADGTLEVFAQRDSGVVSLDVGVSVPSGAVAGFAVLRSVLDEAVRLAAQGRMLAPPTPPEILRLRNWCCDEVLRQAAGLRPVPWSRVVEADQGSAEWSTPEWDASAVRFARAAVLAADDANRIIAVSPTAAELLGWQAEELTGERLIAVIPPQLREAHIAGFMRYQTTGRSRIIGTPVPVAALRRDGSTVAVELLLEARPAGNGRTVFVAELREPAEPTG